MVAKDISSQILDKLKEIATDVAATQQRVADMESSHLEKIDLIRIQLSIRNMEKRLTAMENKMATKTDLNKLESKLDRKFTELFDFLDTDVMDLKKRVIHLENSFPTIPS